MSAACSWLPVQRLGLEAALGKEAGDRPRGEDEAVIRVAGTSWLRSAPSTSRRSSILRGYDDAASAPAMALCCPSPAPVLQVPTSSPSTTTSLEVRISLEGRSMSQNRMLSIPKVSRRKSIAP